MLTPKGIEELGKLMRRLAARGLAVLFITHKLDEAWKFGDRISILRLGRKVGEIPPERLAALEERHAVQEIVALMFGSDAAGTGEPRGQRKGASGGKPMLEVRGLLIEDRGSIIGGEGIDLSVAPGEILGIAGIDGNGQKELAEALAGQRRAVGGDILLEGKRLNDKDVGARRRLGLRYLTDDRLSEGSVAPFPLALNLVLKEIGKRPYWRRGIEQRDQITGHAERLIEQFDVRTPGPETPIGRLSGGNIQKALLARELVEGARAVIFSKPTYGLDAQNTVAFRRRIREIAAAGIAVVLISTDLEELLELSDRIAVMARGRVVGTVDNDERARMRVGGMMAGVAG
jgi:simple sugar transport system ATP-binding protein